MTFCSERLSTARKVHRCDQCHTNIEIGQKYLRLAHNWDEEFTLWKSHLDCDECATDLMKLHGLTSPDESVHLRFLDAEDYPFVRDEYPSVAKRLGLVEGDSR